MLIFQDVCLITFNMQVIEELSLAFEMVSSCRKSSVSFTYYSTVHEPMS